MSDNDAREAAAHIFERTSSLATNLARSTPGAAGAALAVAGTIAGAIAGVIRTLGVDGAREAVDELVRRRDEGTITGADIAADDASIRARVAMLYTEPAEPDWTEEE